MPTANGSKQSSAEEDDLRARLDRLRGRDTSSSSTSKRVGSSQAARGPFPVQKKLTEQEEIDLLLNQVPCPRFAHVHELDDVFGIDKKRLLGAIIA